MKVSATNYLRIAIFASMLLVGCDKKPASNPVDSGGTDNVPATGGALSGARRALVFKSLQTVMDSAQRVNPSAMNSTILQFFKTRPEFQYSGIESDSSVYGVFTDGRVMIYADNIPNDPSGRVFGGTLRSSNLIGSLPRVQSTFPSSNDALFGWTYFSPDDNTVFARSTRSLMNDIPIIFKSKYYNPQQGIANIGTLKLVAGPGIFHWSTHGGMGVASDRQTRIYALMASEAMDYGLDSTDYKDDLDTKRMVYFCPGYSIDSSGKNVAKWNYGVTADFVAKYMSFSENSMVFISACTSYNPGIIEGFRKAHASVYLGWDNPVGIYDSDYATEFFFDRCLGSNLVDPIPNPPQRPFEYQYVYDDLAYRGKATSTGKEKTATLRYTQLSGNLGVLLPTIQLVSFVNYGTYQKMTIDGDFGSVPGQVLLNGLPLSLSKAWKSNTLETDMPLGGGNIQVVVNGKKSNVVQLTQWNATVTYTMNGTGTLQKKMIVNIGFLADVHRYRPLPGANIIYKDEAIFGGSRVVSPLTTIVCTYECSGNDKDVSWSGSGTISNIQPAPVVDVPGGFLMGTIGDEGQTTLIDFLATGYYTIKTSSGSSQQKFSTGDTGFPSLQISISPGFLLKANRIVTPTSFGVATMEWTDFKPFAPPDPNAAR